MIRKKYKVSPSLLTSYLNMKNKVYNNSLEGFINTLKRIPLEPNFFLKRGNDFENRVIKMKSEPFHNIIKDCDTQVFVKKSLDFPENEFDIDIVGFIDFVTKDREIIYDTKRVNKWDDEKYDGSTQHDFYLWAIPESKKFYYLVGEGKGWKSEAYHQVEYPKPSEEYLEKYFRDLINEFLDWLRENNMMDIYKKNYLSTKKNKKQSNKKENKEAIVDAI